MLEKYQEIMTSYDFVTKSRGGSKEDGVGKLLKYSKLDTRDTLVMCTVGIIISVVAYRRDLFEYVDREDVEFKGFFHHNRVGTYRPIRHRGNP